MNATRTPTDGSVGAIKISRPFRASSGGSWLSRFLLVTALFIDSTHQLRSFGPSSLPNYALDDTVWSNCAMLRIIPRATLQTDSHLTQHVDDVRDVVALAQADDVEAETHEPFFRTCD